MIPPAYAPTQRSQSSGVVEASQTTRKSSAGFTLSMEKCCGLLRGRTTCGTCDQHCSLYSSQDWHCQSRAPYHLFLSCAIHWRDCGRRHQTISGSQTLQMHEFVIRSRYTTRHLPLQRTSTPSRLTLRAQRHVHLFYRHPQTNHSGLDAYCVRA